MRTTRSFVVKSISGDQLRKFVKNLNTEQVATALANWPTVYYCSGFYSVRLTSAVKFEFIELGWPMVVAKGNIVVWVGCDKKRIFWRGGNIVFHLQYVAWASADDNDRIYVLYHSK